MTTPEPDNLREMPRERGTPVAFVLAVLAHVALAILLVIGIRWQSKPAATVEAELWASLPPAAAPKAEPKPEPQPEPRPEPKPEPQPEPPKPVETPPAKKPDIAIEEEKKKQKEAEEREKKEALRKEQEKKEREEEKRKAEEKKKAEEQKRKEQALRDKIRQQEMARIAGTAGPSTATAPRSGGPKGDPTWEGRVRQCIKPHMVFNEGNVSGNLIATFRVQVTPSGEQLGTPRLVKSSGNGAYDAAVERAISRCEPFPLPSGGFQRDFQIDYRLKD